MTAGRAQKYVHEIAGPVPTLHMAPRSNIFRQLSQYIESILEWGENKVVHLWCWKQEPPHFGTQGSPSLLAGPSPHLHSLKHTDDPLAKYSLALISCSLQLFKNIDSAFYIYKFGYFTWKSRFSSSLEISDQLELSRPAPFSSCILLDAICTQLHQFTRCALHQCASPL